MGNDLHLKCQVETRRFLWIIGLVLASVLVIQYFELPCSDKLLSLLSSGKSYFNFSVANNTTNIINSPSISKSGNATISPVTFSPENATSMSRTAEPEMIIGGIGIAPESSRDVSYRFDEISPSDSSMWGDNSRINSNSTSLDVSSAPLISPSNSVSWLDASSAPLISPSQSVEASSPPTIAGDEKLKKNENVSSDTQVNNSPPPPPPCPQEMPKSQVASVVTISDMNDMLLRSRVSSSSKVCIYS